MVANSPIFSFQPKIRILFIGVWWFKYVWWSFIWRHYNHFCCSPLDSPQFRTSKQSSPMNVCQTTYFQLSVHTLSLCLGEMWANGATPLSTINIAIIQRRTFHFAPQRLTLSLSAYISREIEYPLNWLMTKWRMTFEVICYCWCRCRLIWCWNI